MNIICKTCLKYPVCVNKQEVVCPDLFKALVKYDFDTEKSVSVITEFEKWWGKEMSIINTSNKSIRFKDKEDNYSCLICHAK